MTRKLYWVGGDVVTWKKMRSTCFRTVLVAARPGALVKAEIYERSQLPKTDGRRFRWSVEGVPYGVDLQPFKSKRGGTVSTRHIYTEFGGAETLALAKKHVTSALVEYRVAEWRPIR